MNQYSICRARHLGAAANPAVGAMAERLLEQGGALGWRYKATAGDLEDVERSKLTRVHFQESSPRDAAASRGAFAGDLVGGRRGF